MVEEGKDARGMEGILYNVYLQRKRGKGVKTKLMSILRKANVGLIIRKIVLAP